MVETVGPRSWERFNMAKLNIWIATTATYIHSELKIHISSGFAPCSSFEFIIKCCRSFIKLHSVRWRLPSPVPSVHVMNICLSWQYNNDSNNSNEVTTTNNFAREIQEFKVDSGRRNSRWHTDGHLIHERVEFINFSFASSIISCLGISIRSPTSIRWPLQFRRSNSRCKKIAPYSMLTLTSFFIVAVLQLPQDHFRTSNLASCVSV